MQNRENAGKNKKTVLTIAIALLLVLALALGGFTFARYISQGSGSDTAKVAAWGVEITANAESSAFASDYNLASGSWAEKTADAGVAVNASAEAVAPGTRGAGAEMFTITGTPEVAVEIVYKLTVASDVKLVLTPTGSGEEIEYYPIRYTLNRDGSPIDAAGHTLSGISGWLETNGTQKFPAGTNLASESVVSYTLSWEWAFSNTGMNENADALDTILGNDDTQGETVTVGGVEYKISEISRNVEFSMSVTVQQIQSLD